jgi:hypothetical protein
MLYRKPSMADGLRRAWKRFRGVIRGSLEWYTQESHGGYSSVAERRSVDPDVVGSTPTSRPKYMKETRVAKAALFSWLHFIRTIVIMNSRAFAALTIDCG